MRHGNGSHSGAPPHVQSSYHGGRSHCRPAHREGNQLIEHAHCTLEWNVHTGGTQKMNITFHKTSTLDTNSHDSSK